MMGSDSEPAVILVIGYGNELRGDDGLGPAVAEAVAAIGLPDVECLAVHQLVPELAERLADARLAVFVDARVGPGEQAVEVTRIKTGESGGLMAHAADPRALLALARAVYGRAPEAWLVAVTGCHFEFGDGLSLVGVENANEARQRVIGLIGERTCPAARKME
jgi:hydrogenase maturation protease